VLSSIPNQTSSGAPELRDHREKTERERVIEQRWRQRLLEGGSVDDFADAYDQLHKEFLDRQQGQDGEIYGEVNPRSTSEDRVRAVILRAVGSGKRVLEVGTGDGETAYQLARQGNAVTSCDVSRLALEKAQAHWGNIPGLELHFAFGDARQLPAEANAFDIVISENMVEHISLEDMRAHLAEVRRVLAPRGCYLLYTPTRLWSGRMSVGFHLHVYTLHELCALMRNEGFAPRWLEPRLLHRTGRLWTIGTPLIWLAWGWEALLGVLRVWRWPVALKARVLPSIMLRAHLRNQG
jgi:2-polyprenyl-3-methyl-5-hydroxy-6-metoxy-1,4-benzoquinol methylase